MSSNMCRHTDDPNHIRFIVSRPLCFCVIRRADLVKRRAVRSSSPTISLWRIRRYGGEPPRCPEWTDPCRGSPGEIISLPRNVETVVHGANIEVTPPPAPPTHEGPNPRLAPGGPQSHYLFHFGWMDVDSPTRMNNEWVGSLHARSGFQRAKL